MCIFGMEMEAESFLTRADSLIESKVILDLYMGSNGDTLEQHIKIFIQTIQVKEWIK